MTNEEIVKEKLEKLPSSPIYFQADWNRITFQNRIRDLRESKSVRDRIAKIMELSVEYESYIGNRFQCGRGRRRSAHDIWRIYENYFGETDIFVIMRELYNLTVKEKLFNTIRCSTICKRVFWYKSRDVFSVREYEPWAKAELGVKFTEWKNIGLKGDL